MKRTFCLLHGSNGLHYLSSRVDKALRKVKSERLNLQSFSELNFMIHQNFTVQELALFVKRVEKEDLRHPILIDPNGRIIYGVLALLKALIRNKDAIRSKKIERWTMIEEALYDNKRYKIVPHLDIHNAIDQMNNLIKEELERK